MNNQNILHNAVLVNLSIGQYNPRRADRVTTDEVLAGKHAKKSAGVWQKNRIDPEALKPVQRAASEARGKHTELSLPWGDAGWRILPTSIYSRYQDELRAAKTAWGSQVDAFIAAWPDHVEAARVALNGMFDPGDYPDIEAVRKTFYFRVEVSPLPAGDDFRVTLGEDEVERLKQDVDNRVRDAVQDANRDLWRRLATPVAAMVDRLGTADKIFRDSLVDNVGQIVSLIPALNVTGDAALEQIAQDCRAKLTRYSPEILRTTPQARAATAQAAQELLDRMKGYV